MLEVFAANFANYLSSEPFVADCVVSHELGRAGIFFPDVSRGGDGRASKRPCPNDSCDAASADDGAMMRTLLRPVELDLFEIEYHAFGQLPPQPLDEALLYARVALNPGRHVYSR